MFDFNHTLDLIRLGDEAALGLIYAEFGRLVKLVAFDVTGDWQHASAVLNDVLVVIWQKAERLRGIRNPEAFMYDLAKKRAISYYRKYLKKQRREVEFSHVSSGEAQQLTAQDEHGTMYFWDMIKNLDQTDQEIVELKIAQGYTHAEIADRLKIPIGTIKWKYSQILKKLKQNQEKQSKDSQQNQAREPKK